MCVWAWACACGGVFINWAEDSADVRGNLQCECKYHSWDLELVYVNGPLGVQPAGLFENLCVWLFTGVRSLSLSRPLGCQRSG